MSHDTCNFEDGRENIRQTLPPRGGGGGGGAARLQLPQMEIKKKYFVEMVTAYVSRALPLFNRNHLITGMQEF